MPKLLKLLYYRTTTDTLSRCVAN